MYKIRYSFGVYLYSYATDERAALSEARHVMRLIQDYQMEYPIYLDLEDPSIGRLTNDQIEKMQESGLMSLLNIIISQDSMLHIIGGQQN